MARSKWSRAALSVPCEFCKMKESSKQARGPGILWFPCNSITVHGDVMARAFYWSWVQLLVIPLLDSNLRQVVHTIVLLSSVINQYRTTGD